MSADGDTQTPHEVVIVRRRGGDGDDGHHGGAWKIAFADLMTAMMAFFLVMWLLNVSDKEKIQQNFHALWEVGLLENVSIEAEREGGGVTLIVTIEERPVIKDVEFTGNKKLSSSQIRDVLREANKLIQPAQKLESSTLYLSSVRERSEAGVV